MPNLACIIPVMGDTEGLETTLISVLERRTDACEVLVVLNVPYDDPYHLQDEITFIPAPAHAGLVGCVNIGIAATQAPIVHLLAAGCEVNRDWIEQALVHFDDPRVAAVAPSIFSAADHSCLLAAGAEFTTDGKKIITDASKDDGASSTSLGPLIQAAFYRRSALQPFGGGLPSDVSEGLADVDLALSLHQAGWQLVQEPNCQVFALAITNAPAAGFWPGLWEERLYWRHFAAGGGFTGILVRPFAVMRDSMRVRPMWKSPVHALGRLIGMCQFGQFRKYEEMLAIAKIDASSAEAQWQNRRSENNAQSGNPNSLQRRTDPPHKNAPPHATKKDRQTQRQKANR